MHFNGLKKAFIECDESGERKGIISKKDYLMKIAEDSLKFPLDFLICFIHDIQLDPFDFSDNASIDYENLKTIYDIFINSSAFNKGEH